MVSLKIQEWLAPEIKKERDLLALQVHDLKQRLTEAEQVAARFMIQDQKHRIELETYRRPETPKVLRAGTAAEVRKLAEQAFSVEES